VDIKKLSIVIPFYNESATLEVIFRRVVNAELTNGIQKEIILVDDASTDNSWEIAEKLKQSHKDLVVLLIKHESNEGKGAAIHSGIKNASGDYLIIQDADLEYNPDEYNKLIVPVLRGEADVVYGSRFAGGEPHRILFFWHSIGNKILTTMSNMFTNLNLTDMETCYKLFKTDIIKGISLREKRFGFEPEVTAKISRIEGIRIFEVGISYYGRTYEEGKKIRWNDGLRAIYCIFKYNIIN
jgi:glycosyltransferase involved in cell wall biosynthesis